MTFDDSVLVDRIKSSLQTLFEKQMMMNATLSSLGIPLEPAAADPFASSILFTSAFEFTWPMSRSVRNPEMVILDACSLPVMCMKVDFARSSSVFEEFRALLPDLLSDKRSPVPRARWKDLWSSEPSSVAAMEKQIIKLAEQALWSMGTDPAYATDACSRVKAKPDDQVHFLLDAMNADDVPFEDWMVDSGKPKPQNASGCRDSKKKQKKRLRGAAATPQRPPSPVRNNEEEEEEDEEAEEDASRTQSSEHISADDESVGHGVFNVGHYETGLSTAMTAASTPALVTGNCLKGLPLLPPASPTQSAGSMLQPRQLVCYIWNQTSQFPNHDSPDSPSRSRADSFSRGAWLEPSQPDTPATPVAKAIVKNTFLDIDDPHERPHVASRASRSLSPSYSRDESWHDHWHV